MNAVLAFQRLEGFELDSSVGEVIHAMYDRNSEPCGENFDMSRKMGTIGFDKAPRSFLAEDILPRDRFYFPRPVCLAVCRPILERLDNNLTLGEVASMKEVAYPYDSGD